MPRLLVNFVTWPAVGHAVHGLAVALGYARANPDCEVHLVLNSHTVVELASLCPWIAAVHTVEFPSGRSTVDTALFDHIPREWDYVVFERHGEKSAYSEYVDQASRYFRGRIASGFCFEPPVPFDRLAQLKFAIPLPAENRAFARGIAPDDGRHIGVMPAGGSSKAHYYPSPESWSRIIEGLKSSFPDATVYLFGRLNREGHPNTTAITRGDVDVLLQRFPFARDCFDIGLLNQLAVAERCSVFVAPHTGFAFAVLAVGTPWLTISGGRWPEFFHTGVPFYSVLPDPMKYPAFDSDTFDTLADDGRILSMCDLRIDEDLPEILEAAKILVESRWSFDKCLRYYRRRRAVLYGTRRERLIARARELGRFAFHPAG